MMLSDITSSSGSGGGEVVKAGYLTKSPPASRAPVSHWHRRWFQLMCPKVGAISGGRYITMAYYQSEADAKRLADPKGVIDLTTCVSVIALAEPLKNFRFVFDVSTTERVYHLAAECEEERQEWVSILKELLFPPRKNSCDTTQRTPRDLDVRRVKGDSRNIRPHSLESSLSPSVRSMPLPPVPGGNSPSSSSEQRRLRPLPFTPPPACTPQPKSYALPLKTPLPPAKPAPYRKNASEPAPPLPHLPQEAFPPRPNSFSPPALLEGSDYAEIVDGDIPSEPQDYHQFVTSGPQVAEDYQEFVARDDLSGQHYGLDDTEDNYSLATSVPGTKKQDQATSQLYPNKTVLQDGDYSILEHTPNSYHNNQGHSSVGENVIGPKSKNLDCKSLDVDKSPLPPIREASLGYASSPVASQRHHFTKSSDTNTPSPKPRRKPKPRPQPSPHPSKHQVTNRPDYENWTDGDDYSVLQH